MLHCPLHPHYGRADEKEREGDTARDRFVGGSFFGDHLPVGWASFRLSQPVEGSWQNDHLIHLRETEPLPGFL